jgi:hypothetical protein
MRPLLAVAYIVLSSFLRFVGRNAIAIVSLAALYFARTLQPPAIRYIVSCYFIIEIVKSIRGRVKIDRGN